MILGTCSGCGTVRTTGLSPLAPACGSSTESRAAAPVLGIGHEPGPKARALAPSATDSRLRPTSASDAEVARAARLQSPDGDADAPEAGNAPFVARVAGDTDASTTFPVLGGGMGRGAGGEGEDAANPSTPAAGRAVSGNPAAVNIITGTGRLGEILGVNRNGFRVGGLNITDGNGILAGGLGPGKWAGNSLTIADLSIDAEEMLGWKGGLFGTQFLYYTGFGPGYTIAGIEQGKNSPNSLAGTVMGFNSLDVVPPLSRAELYELWFRQEFFDKKLVVRLGKSVPTYDFNNVSRAVPMRDQAANIPAVTSALFTPVFVIPTMLGVIPGYYNSATGLVASYVPTDKLYLQYGFFDGNLARGKQTGLEGPHFNGYYFHIGEVGTNWTVGEDKCPGQLGVGYWGQTGKLTTFDRTTVNGAQGVYLIASQRLYFAEPGKSNKGLTSYYQFGATDSQVIFTHRYFGCGLTYFGPLPGRDNDSVGFGLAQGWMTNDPNAAAGFFTLPPGTHLRTNRLGKEETILTWYYQMDLGKGTFFQPNLTYIPDPARHPGIPGAFALTLRMIVLF